MFNSDSFVSETFHYLIQDRRAHANEKNSGVFTIVEEESGVCLYRATTRQQSGVYELILKDANDNFLLKIRQSGSRLRLTFVVSSEACYPMAIIKRKYVLSRLRQYTVDSIYGHYHLTGVHGQHPSFLLEKNKDQIAYGSKYPRASIAVEMEYNENQKFILALFVLMFSS